MSALLCPYCGKSAEPAAHVANIAVCSTCGTTVVIAPDGTATKATAQDTTVLGPSDLEVLRRARAKIAREGRT